MNYAFAPLVLEASVIISSSAGGPAVQIASGHFASAPHTCGALQAAYTTAIKSRSPVYPADIRSSPKVLSPSKLVPEYRAKLALTKIEFADLSVQAGQYDFANFQPHCAWKGIAGFATDHEGHPTHVKFTSPIFSTDRQLVLVEVSFHEAGGFGYGLICVVRKKSHAWTALCQESWIT